LMIVREEDDRLEPVRKFMEALNINMESTFQFAAEDGSVIEKKVSDIFFNL
jgi:hypothetical protein